MTRDEILEKSRKMNIGMDEREQKVRAEGGDIAGRVMVCIGLFLNLFNQINDGPKVVHYTIWLMVAANYAITTGYEAYHLKKRSWWLWVAFFTVVFVLYTVLFWRDTFGG